ncbi:exodeoxyribonuclease VII small subunit [Atopobium fossor]|uniref:exodeoxyribonuclease VII small subunit n=1 Tax=Atopobium fossor TaxID=39487 RepID=UPI0004204586|nr:exodeoxyribonuclease VII small subunit [Atopobium fossor]
MARVDTSTYKSFDDIVGRLDEIVGVVRDKDTSLERSLDLFEEAISLGSKAVDMVDKVDFTAQELAQMEEEAQADSDSDSEIE